ncbi:hypothetical protein CYMTET_2794 [Cymbomonas tetramitiformis]|uniref:EamA domain-containing protein n=1 Tax=Cymbomonas tetramitiformis TaxID=36881 RepID=A0AAE0LLQ4_9CHLO|nr:hypothetical protein CYMTET_2794 [Cymbomonas tetramitiformis]
MRGGNEKRWSKTSAKHCREPSEAPPRQCNRSILIEPLLFLWGGSEHSGICCAVLSSLLYSIMGLLVKMLARDEIPSFETALCRSALVGIFASFGVLHNGESLLGVQEVRHLLAGRAAAALAANLCFFYSLSEMSLKNAAVINLTSPMFTAIASSLILQESWGGNEFCGMLGSFAGVLLIAQPPFMIGAVRHENLEDDVEMKGSPVAVAVGLLGAACAGCAYTLVRAAGRRGLETAFLPVLWFSFTSVPVAATFLCLLQQPVWPQLHAMLGMAAVGLLGFGGQLLMSRALQLERATRATSMQYLKVLFSFLLSTLFLHESPTWSSVIGALLIVGSTTLIIANIS